MPEAPKDVERAMAEQASVGAQRERAGSVRTCPRCGSGDTEPVADGERRPEATHRCRACGAEIPRDLSPAR